MGQITGDLPSGRQRVPGKCQREGRVGRDVGKSRNGERRLGHSRRQRPCVAGEAPARNRKTVIRVSHQTGACRRDGDGGGCTRGKLPVDSRGDACRSAAFGNAGEERLDKGDGVVVGGDGEGVGVVVPVNAPPVRQDGFARHDGHGDDLLFFGKCVGGDFDAGAPLSRCRIENDIGKHDIVPGVVVFVGGNGEGMGKGDVVCQGEGKDGVAADHDGNIHGGGRRSGRDFFERCRIGRTDADDAARMRGVNQGDFMHDRAECPAGRQASCNREFNGFGRLPDTFVPARQRNRATRPVCTDCQASRGNRVVTVPSLLRRSGHGDIQRDWHGCGAVDVHRDCRRRSVPLGKR